jgi:hypothetical protein
MNEAHFERDSARIERELFIGFYSIRKLLDTFKVSSGTRREAYSLVWSPRIGRPDYFSWHRLEEHFDLGTQNEETRDLVFLCNQFVHSFIFTVVTDEKNSLAGVFVASDKTRNEKLYFVAASQILLAFRTVGRDYPVKQHMVRNERTGEWEERDA